MDLNRIASKIAGEELEPGVYDERIKCVDAQRKCKRELNEGSTLSAIYEARRSRKGTGYRVLSTALVKDGQVIFVLRYDRAGRVHANQAGPYSFYEITDKYPPCIGA